MKSMQKIVEDLISKFDKYLLSIKNCENIKKLKYKTDLVCYLELLQNKL